MSLQQKLHDLFLVDQQLRGLRSRLDSATARLGKQQAKLDQFQRQRAELGEQLKQAQVKATTLEKQIKDMEDRIETLRGQMLNVKSHKEYSAFTIEVSTLKVDKGKVEDQTLEAMGKVDALKKEVELAETKITDQTKLVGVAVGEVKSCQAEVGQQVSDLTEKRQKAEAEVPEDARALFNRMCHVHEGEPMASVIEESRRHMEYSCGGCFLGLPAERMNALLCRPDEVVSCPSCGRILYVEKELRDSLTQTASK